MLSTGIQPEHELSSISSRHANGIYLKRIVSLLRFAGPWRETHDVRLLRAGACLLACILAHSETYQQRSELVFVECILWANGRYYMSLVRPLR
jgi:hypothetical protein